MSPGLKSLTTSFLLACFTALSVAQSVPSVRSMKAAERFAAPLLCQKLASHAVEEVGGTGTDSTRAPQPELERDEIVPDYPASTAWAPARGDGPAPFNPFWAAIIRRQIAAGDSGDH
jgi:hypothetical protein